MFRRWLAHPLTRGLSLDDPRTTALRREIIRSKPFLRQIYEEWYLAIERQLPAGEGRVLELGSGGGFFREVVGEAITSEVFSTVGADIVVDAGHLAFRGRSLRAIVMVDVFHHLPEPRRFLSEAARCVRPGGRVVMIEPWVTWWSRLIYRHLHHEPFCPDAPHWELSGRGPLTAANGALPWIVFARDRADFAREFPSWRLVSIRPFLPVSYLLSGGVSLRSFLPAAAYRPCRAVERVAESHPGNGLSMFAEIVLERTPVASPRSSLPSERDASTLPEQ